MTEWRIAGLGIDGLRDLRIDGVAGPGHNPPIPGHCSWGWGSSSIHQSDNPTIRQSFNPTILQSENPWSRLLGMGQQFNPSIRQSDNPSIPQSFNPKIPCRCSWGWGQRIDGLTDCRIDGLRDLQIDGVADCGVERRGMGSVQKKSKKTLDKTRYVEPYLTSLS